MTEPRSAYHTCEGREIHVTGWGDPAAPAVIAWHGLARTGRDMDPIATVLARRFHVICPDTIGRGFSQWSPDPAAEYCLAFYEKLAVSLLDQLGVAECAWLGTSMGGAIGLKAAAGALRGRILRLVLNDIGPELAAPAVARIRAYAGNPPAFATMTELESFFRTVYAPYGWLPDVQWRQLTETSARRLPDGRWTPHYDPAMVQQFEHHPQDYDQWPAWDSLSLPVLCLRGETSDLLLPDVAEAMRTRGPRAVVATIPGCGHAPALNTEAQIGLVERFLAGD
ncbi:alpha/beta fold hydrolase [Rubrivivax albus]|uniref:Alpha/beta hydrolase n=1 Tax=Rubrivivax albus TaxID=2499835 RepID=A0A3S2X1W9_9BURK|nr:alpha/beta hydrolase [Rubrivivax albus]RVT52198.1 alpha/beta hydrolase [Rubrivivax albus]